MLFSCEGNRERCQEDVILRGLNVSMIPGFGLHVPRTTVPRNKFYPKREACMVLPVWGISFLEEYYQQVNQS